MAADNKAFKVKYLIADDNVTIKVVDPVSGNNGVGSIVINLSNPLTSSGYCRYRSEDGTGSEKLMQYYCFRRERQYGKKIPAT